MFIKSAHQICIQTSTQPGRVLIGIGSPAPAYMYSQFDISETEAREFAAALLKVADEAAQARADTDRLSGIVAEAMREGAL
jgi:hypothetical protein